MHGLAILLALEIEHDAALAAVEQREEGRAHAAERAGLVAGGRLDLDHLGAQLGEDHAAGRAHDHMGHLHDPYALERQSDCGHFRLSLNSLERLGFRAPSENYNLSKGAFADFERL